MGSELAYINVKNKELESPSLMTAEGAPVAVQTLRGKATPNAWGLVGLRCVSGQPAPAPAQPQIPKPGAA